MGDFMTITHDGNLDKLISKMTPDLYREPAKAGMKQIGSLGKSQAKSMSPHASGRMAASVGYRTSLPKTGNMSATIRVSAKGLWKGQPYSYPRRQNYDHKMGHYLWLNQALEAVAARFEAVIATMAEAIAQRWRM